MAASVTVIGPTPGATPGTPGAFSADWAVARETPIVLEITGTVYELVAVQYPGQLDETVVYRDGSFRGSYAARSTETPISGGVRLSILPAGGWPSSDALNDVTFIVDPVEGAVAAYTVDATNGRPIPQTLTEFDAMLSEIGVASGGPSHGWLVGAAASLPVADVIGGKSLSDSTSGGPAALTYAVARAGWSAKFLRFTSGTPAVISNGTLGNVNANPYLMIARVAITTATGAARSVMHIGSVFDDDAAVETNTTPRMQLGEGFGAARKAGAVDPVTGGVLTLAMLVDPVTWKTCLLYTLAERISAPRGGIYCNGTTVAIGGDNTQTWQPPGMEVLDAWLFTGAAARKTTEEIRSIISKLDGASPSWRSWNIMKTGATILYDAGAASTQTFAGDVYAEFEVGAASTGEMAFGLSDTDVDQNYTSIDFGVLHDAGNMYRIEAGALTSLAHVASSGDKYRVSRESGTMKLYRNGVLIHTFGTTTAAALRVDTSFRTQDATLHNIRVVVGSVEQQLSWGGVTSVVTF